MALLMPETAGARVVFVARLRIREKVLFGELALLCDNSSITSLMASKPCTMRWSPKTPAWVLAA